MNHRLIALCAAFLVAFGILWMRCVWLQVIAAGRLAKMARAQHHVSHVLLARRGAIIDRSGEPLALSTRIPSVFANPRRMLAKDQVALRLTKLLGRDQHLLRRRLDQDRGFVWLARHVDPDLAEPLGSLRDEEVGVIEETKRVYPNGTLASHVLGSVDLDERGLEGVELAFNGILRGRTGWQATVRDAKGDLLLGPWTTTVDPQPGFDVVLTIDRVVQGVAEEALGWGVQKFRAKGGCLIVMDPHSGQILALANSPRFDPNHPGRAAADARRNRAITDLIEPGSVFKIVAASALFEEGLIRPEERIFCERGSYPTVARHILHDHRPHGWLTFHDVIAYSSNIGTAKAAQRLAPQVLHRYIRAFGFGQQTGVELPGEVSGIVASPARWSRLSPFIIPIGQEVAVTPIQLAVMTSVIANGGWRVSPSVVERIQGPAGELIRRTPASPRERLISPETTQRVEAMLLSVVESGTGRLAKIHGLTVAGKTGTAQKLEPNGRYSHSRYVASFVGYGPVPDSRFVIVVTVDEPRPTYFGGTVAAPVFQRVVKRLASYWDLTPPVGLHTMARLP